jgi:hypothetical protein
MSLSKPNTKWEGQPLGEERLFIRNLLEKSKSILVYLSKHEREVLTSV